MTESLLNFVDVCARESRRISGLPHHGEWLGSATTTHPLVMAVTTIRIRISDTRPYV